MLENQHILTLWNHLLPWGGCKFPLSGEKKELWGTIPPAAQAALLVAFEQLHQWVEQLECGVADLRSRMNQNSTPG